MEQSVMSVSKFFLSRRDLFGVAASGACASLLPATVARADVRPETFSSEEIVDNGHRFFGSIARGLAEGVEGANKRWGRPNAYILGQEGSGAFIGGLRYGEGTMYTRNAGKRKVYWQGPTIGLDAGADGDRTQGAARAEMAAEQPQGGLKAAGGRLPPMLVIEPVEAEAAQALLPPGLGNGIGEGLLRQGGVKRRVETGPLLQARAIHEPADHRERRTVMQWRQRHQVGQGGADLLREQGGGCEPGAAMHQAMHHQ